MKNIIIVGAGGFGREMLMTINEINHESQIWNVLGFIDDNPYALDGIKCDRGIIGDISHRMVENDEEYVIAIANPVIKKRIVEDLKKRGAKFATIIHPTTRLDKSTEIGEGVVLAARADITTNCIIGDFVFCNVAAQVGHDSVVGSYSTLFPNCSIAGGSVLGEGVTVGTSASTHPGIKVGDYATLGMNSAVIRNVKAFTTVMGVPAKRIL